MSAASSNIKACARVIADDLLLVDEDELSELTLHDEYLHFNSTDATRLIEELVTDCTFLTLMNQDLLDKRLKAIGLDEHHCSQIKALFAYNLQTYLAQITFEPWVRIYVLQKDGGPFSFCIPSRLLESLNERMELGSSEVHHEAKLNHFRDSFNYIGMASRAETILYFLISSCYPDAAERDVGYSMDYMKLNVDCDVEIAVVRHAFVRL